MTAVVVAAENPAGLSRTVQAVQGRAQRIITVGIGADACRITLPSGTPFSRGYTAGVEAAEAEGAEWVWLLPAGAVPEDGALDAQWETAQQSATIEVLGPLHLAEDGRILEAGMTAGTGWRLTTGLAPEEIDQGQYADRSDVLATGMHGMLVNIAAYRRAGGFHHLLGTAYGALDFCRRARLAGSRVCLVPEARLRHPAEAARTWHPDVQPARALEARWSTWLLACRPGVSFFLLLWLQLLGLLRALYRLAAKQPRHALAELRAATTQLGRFGAILGLRRRTAKTTRLPRSALDSLRLDWRSTRAAARIETSPDEPGPSAAAAAVAGEGGPEDLRTAPINTENVVAGFSPIDALGAPRMRIATHPAVLLTVLALACAVAGQFRLAVPGYLTGGALAATDVSWPELFAAATGTWHPAGLGHTAPPDPMLGVLALWSLLFLGQVALSVTVLWFLALPLAALSAYTAAGALTRSAWIRAGAGLVWAAMPTLLLALDEGRIGTVVAHVLLPLAALGLIRATGAARPGRRMHWGRPGSAGVPSWTAAAAGGLAFGAAAAGAPILILAAVPVVLIAALAAGRGRRAPLLVFPLGTAALCLPWLIRAVRQPELLFSQHGRLLSEDPVPVWQLLLLQPSAAAGHDWLSGLDPHYLLLLLSPLLALYVLGMLRPHVPTGVLAWSAGLVLLGLAAAVAPLTVAVGADPLVVAAGSPGPGLSLLGLGFLAAAVHAVRWQGRRSSMSWLSAALAALLAVGSLGQLGVWSVEGALQQRATSAVGVSEAPSLSALARDRYAGPHRQRALVLRQVDGQVLGEIRGPEGGTILAVSQAVSGSRVNGPFGWRQAQGLDEAEHAIGSAVAALTAGAGTDATPLLSQIGVGTVILELDPPAAGAMAPAGSVLAEEEDSARLDAVSSALDNSQGLSRLGESAAGRMWSVDAADEPSWAVLEGEDGTRQPLEVSADGSIVVPEGSGSRRVVLAQRADEGFTATIAQTRVEPAAGDWRLAFDVPPAGGTLDVHHREAADATWTAVRGVLLVLALLLSVPLPGGRTGVRPGTVRNGAQPEGGRE